jgi:hypothetical protein
MLEAAEGGNLEVVKWASQNGCPMHPSVLFVAVQCADLEVNNQRREEG